MSDHKAYSGERWLICGGRGFTDAAMMERVLSELVVERGHPECVIHGNARGADTLAGAWARSVDIEVHEEPVSKEEWLKYGKAAGPIRNQRMLDVWAPNLVIAFPGQTGTSDMADRAHEHGVEVIHVSAEGTLTRTNE